MRSTTHPTARVAAAMGVIALVAACTGGSETDPEPGPTTTSSSSTTSTSTPEGFATLTLGGLVFLDSYSSTSVRVQVESSADTVEVLLPPIVGSPSGRLLVCPILSVEDRSAPRGPGCVLAAGGERVTMPHRPDYGGVDVGLIPGVGMEQSFREVAVDDLRIVYRPAGPATILALPPLPAGTRVVISRSPTSTDPFAAQATWPDGDGTARLTIEAGASVTSVAEGPPPLQATSQVSPAAPAALTFEATSSLPGSTLDVSWP